MNFTPLFIDFSALWGSNERYKKTDSNYLSRQELQGGAQRRPHPTACCQPQL